MRFQDLRLKGLGTGFLGAGVLGLMLGTCGMVWAQDEPKPPQQEEPRQDEAKPPKQQEPKEAKPPKNEKQEEKQNNEMKTEKDQQKNEMKSEKEKEQDRPVQNNGGDHAARASEQRGQRIPEDKFRSHFGRQHTFRVQTTVVEGQPRFQYGGYWFSLVDAWPVGWAYTDDCYIDFIDGEYVLIDLLHPGVQIAVLVVG
jgi:hypothetical protein